MLLSFAQCSQEMDLMEEVQTLHEVRIVYLYNGAFGATTYTYVHVYAALFTDSSCTGCNTTFDCMESEEKIILLTFDTFVAYRLHVSIDRGC